METTELKFEADGAEIISGAVSALTLETLAGEFEQSGKRPGRRDFGTAALGVAQGELARVAYLLSGLVMRPVRIVLFDKTAATNWAVPWHQDRTIAAAGRYDVAGFDAWNVKDGVHHVEPPPELLSRMMTLRLHLDDTGAENGALDILPGSHRLGRVPAADAVRLGNRGPVVTCVAGRGEVLAMRLTTIHKSERSVQPSRRRVLHVDYSADALPLPLIWALQA